MRIYYGVITAVNGNGTYGLQPHSSDHAYTNVPGIQGSKYREGDTVPFVLINGDWQMPQIIQRSESSWHMGAIPQLGNWPVFRHNQHWTRANAFSDIPANINTIASTIGSGIVGGNLHSSTSVILLNATGIECRTRAGTLTWSLAMTVSNYTGLQNAGYERYAIQGDYLYIYGDLGSGVTLHKIAIADGTVAWSSAVDLTAFDYLVVDDVRVYTLTIRVSYAGDALVRAINVSDGTQAWQLNLTTATIDGYTGWVAQGTPRLLLDDAHLYLRGYYVSGADYWRCCVLALDLTTGAVSHSWLLEDGTAAPWHVHIGEWAYDATTGIIYCALGPTLENGEFTLHALDTDTGTVSWTQALGSWTITDTRGGSWSGSGYYQTTFLGLNSASKYLVLLTNGAHWVTQGGVELVKTEYQDATNFHHYWCGMCIDTSASPSGSRILWQRKWVPRSYRLDKADWVVETGQGAGCAHPPTPTYPYALTVYSPNPLFEWSKRFENLSGLAGGTDGFIATTTMIEEYLQPDGVGGYVARDYAIASYGASLNATDPGDALTWTRLPLPGMYLGFRGNAAIVDGKMHYVTNDLDLNATTAARLKVMVIA